MWAAPPVALLLVPAAVVGLGAASALLTRPVGGLVTAIVLAAGLTGYSDSAGLGEVVFGAYAVVYLGLWYGTRLIEGRPLVRSRTDACLAVFIGAGLAGGAGLGLVMGADLGMFVGEFRSFAMLLFYFPVREACSDHPDGAAAVAKALIVVGLVAGGWNAYVMWSAFSSASELWQIIDVRSAYGEATLTSSLLLALTVLLTSRSRAAAVGWAVVVATLLVGVILTKSRGYWAAGVVGGVVLAAILSRADRRRLAGAVGGVLVASAVVSLALFGKYVQLLVVGLAKRFLTLGDAATVDVSLINRFYESAAAWDRIAVNPVLGYGFGVPFRRYDLIYGGTLDWAFIHNAYLGMWYKLGLWGLVLVGVAWVSTFWNAAAAGRARGLQARERALGAGVAGGLIAIAIAANTSNPFMLADQTLVVGILFGMAAGLGLRAKTE